MAQVEKEHQLEASVPVKTDGERVGDKRDEGEKGFE